MVSVASAGKYSITNAAAGGALAGMDILLDKGVGANFVAGQTFVVYVYGLYTQLGNAQLVVSDAGNGYTGPADTTYMVQVVTGSNTLTGAVLRITDSAGVDVIQTGVATTTDVAFPVGSYGLSMKFASTTPVVQVGLRAGDVYFINAVASAASKTIFDQVILDGPAVDTSLFDSLTTAIDVSFRLPYTGEVKSTDASDGEAWTAAADGITTEVGVALNVAARSVGHQWVNFLDGVGSLFPSFRSLVPPAYGEDRITVSSDSDISANVGPVDIDNELAFGADAAFNGAQGRTIYLLRTKVASTKDVYAIVLLTEDSEAKRAGVAHVVAMSTETKRKFRRLYVGTDSPGSYPVLQKQADGSAFTCTITALGARNVLVQAPTAKFSLLGLVAGDRFLLPGSDAEYAVQSVISDTELQLVSGPVAPVAPAVPFEVWKADTADSQVSYIQNASKALGNRRAVNVWVENGTRYINGVLTTIPSRFIAAEVAGLRTAVLPQQGLTHTEIQSITSSPSMYLRYNDEQLDAIAAAGTFIITQDVDSGAVYIRHQLTTETDKVSLYYEDNIGVNLDNHAFATDDILAPYIGKKNVTRRTITEIRNKLTDLFTASTQTDLDVDIGPALVSFDPVYVAVDPIMKDRIITKTKLFFPLPVNQVAETLEASVATNL